MIEEELAATFARHEGQVPAAEPLRARIDETARRRRRRRTAARSAGLALALAVVVALPALWLAGVRPGGHDRSTLRTAASPAAVARNVLLVTADPASGQAATVLVAHLPVGGGAAYLISVPTDTMVHGTPCGGTAKLSCPLTHGMDAERKAVTSLTGLRLDGTAVVHLDKVPALIDAIGGVDLCVDQPVTSRATGKSYARGCAHFDGTDAVDYAQQPTPADHDFGRQRHGQQLMVAMFTRLMGAGRPASPGQAAGLARLAQGAVTTDTAEGGVAELAGQYSALRPGGVTGLRVPDLYTQRDGTGYQLSGDQATALYAAAQSDALAPFVAAHPDLVWKLTG